MKKEKLYYILVGGKYLVGRGKTTKSLIKNSQFFSTLAEAKKYAKKEGRTLIKA